MTTPHQPITGHDLSDTHTPRPADPGEQTWPPLTSAEVDQLTAWSRSSTRGGFRVWLEHDTTLAAAAAIVQAREAAVLAQRVALLPAESMALTVGLAQVLRGEPADDNVGALCVLALARLVGRHDWTEPAEADQ